MRQIKIQLTLLLLTVLSINTYSQTIKELEYDLSWYKDTEQYGDKINTAKLLHKIDPFNRNAIEYICRFYYDRKIDSVSIFFDKLIHDYPTKPEPYILRADFISFELKSLSDSIFFVKKEKYLKKALIIDHQNIQATYDLSELYYRDFLKPFEKKPDFGFSISENTKSMKIDTTSPPPPPLPVKKSGYTNKKKSQYNYAADSALFYFKKLNVINPQIRDVIYFPIKQLERYKNSSAYARLDSMLNISDNCYIPIWYFANLSADWSNDFSIDLLYEIESSKSKIEGLKAQLVDLEEPCLYNMRISNNRVIYRFIWLRSFDPPISIRIEKEGDLIELYWKLGKGAGGYAPEGIKERGERKISLSDWNRFIDNFNKIGFEKLPNEKEVLMTDGASWTVEKKTSKSYKVHDTNFPGKSLKNSCLFLLNLTGLKIKEENIY